jgi:hypothetical protein
MPWPSRNRLTRGPDCDVRRSTGPNRPVTDSDCLAKAKASRADGGYAEMCVGFFGNRVEGYRHEGKAANGR